MLVCLRLLLIFWYCWCIGWVDSQDYILPCQICIHINSWYMVMNILIWVCNKDKANFVCYIIRCTIRFLGSISLNPPGVQEISYLYAFFVFLQNYKICLFDICLKYVVPYFILNVRVMLHIF